jgi:large subunit ribosomal protein L22
MEHVIHLKNWFILHSAAANAIHNMGLNEASLIISKVKVNEDTTVKK